MKSGVSIVRCGNYDRAAIRTAVREALGLLPEAGALPRGGRVLLKPNLLSSNDPPERAVNTHPEFLRAVAEFFIERSCRVLIGDSCGSLSPGSTARAIAVTGVDRVAAELGAEVVDFDRTPWIERPIPAGRVLHSVRLPRLLDEVDALITLPKFKTHGLTLLTGAVKNQLGLIPGKGKKDAHLAAPRPSALAEALLDLHSVVRPRLAIMDAVVGMEGNGPAAGPARAVGLVLASSDCVALDAVVADIMGFGPGQVDSVRLGHERRLGIGRIDQIDLRGVCLADARLSHFSRPSTRMRDALLGIIPASWVRWAFNTVGSARADVLLEQCALCGECITNCPAGAIRRHADRIRIDAARCISCYCCTEVCPPRAIRMRRPLIGRIVQKGYRLLSRRTS